jgi:hypothetical protein
MMRKIFIILVLIIISASYLSAAAQKGVVSSATGKVQYRIKGSTWIDVSNGMQIPIGAVISTGFKSEAVLDLGSSELLIKQLTRMSIQELSENNKIVRTDLNLRLGRIRANVKTSKGLKHNFTIKTPVSTAAVRGTRFSFDEVNIKVEEGKVVFSNKNNHSATYKGGESGSSTGNQPPAGGLSGREEGIVVSADTSDVLGSESSSFSRGRSGVQYGSIKVNWTYYVPE